MRVAGVIALALVLIFGYVGCEMAVGVGSWGPTRTFDATVNKTYIDYSGSGEDKTSHYMVGTDQGVYEIENGFWLGLYNADEIYSKLQTGKKYHLTTKGNKQVNFFMQEYPYLVKADVVPQ